MNVALFATPIGTYGIAWSDRGIRRIQFPERTTAGTRERLDDHGPDAREGPVSGEARRAVEGILALLRGEPDDLGAVVLDLDGIPPFHRRVYAVARTIARGETLSYGEVAAEAGAPRAPRAVGQALRRNPFAIVVPCHRVVAAGGKPGGFSAGGGIDTKLQLLALEGVVLSGAPSLRSSRVTGAPASLAE